MTMTVGWDFEPKTKERKNGIQGSVIFIFNVVGSQIHQETGAAVVLWVNHSPCTSGVAGSIPGFTSQSDETSSCGSVPICP